MLLRVFILLHLLTGLAASMNITRILQTVEILGDEGKGSLLQIQTALLLMSTMIGLHAVVGLAICFCCLPKNTRRNGNGNILREEDKCSSREKDEMRSEINKCRTRISKLYEEVASIHIEKLALQYQINKTFGKDCDIDKSIVHSILNWFGLA